jgi:hypothetical protein
MRPRRFSWLPRYQSLHSECWLLYLDVACITYLVSYLKDSQVFRLNRAWRSLMSLAPPIFSAAPPFNTDQIQITISDISSLTREFKRNINSRTSCDPGASSHILARPVTYPETDTLKSELMRHSSHRRPTYRDHIPFHRIWYTYLSSSLFNFQKVSICKPSVLCLGPSHYYHISVALYSHWRP